MQICNPSLSNNLNHSWKLTCCFWSLLCGGNRFLCQWGQRILFNCYINIHMRLFFTRLVIWRNHIQRHNIICFTGQDIFLFGCCNRLGFLFACSIGYVDILFSSTRYGRLFILGGLGWCKCSCWFWYIVLFRGQTRRKRSSKRFLLEDRIRFLAGVTLWNFLIQT